jgi:glycosyltransferase involved in cell wall biosynthesis
MTSTAAADDTPRFWLVIPAYREARRLPRYLSELCPLLQTCPLPVTLQIVDDGSPTRDHAALQDAVAPYLQNHPALFAPVLYLAVNQGKGAAIKTGWRTAPAGISHLGFIDADGATPASEVLRLLTYLSASPATTRKRALFASRQALSGKTIQRSALRRFTGNCFRLLTACVLRPGIKDTQCGFKIIPREAFARFDPEMQESRYIFDLELLLLLRRYLYPIEEIPIDWSDQPGSQMNLLRDAPDMAYQRPRKTDPLTPV